MRKAMRQSGEWCTSPSSRALSARWTSDTRPRSRGTRVCRCCGRLKLVDHEVERAEIVKAAVDQFFADALKLRRYYQPHTLESFQRVVHAPPPERVHPSASSITSCTGTDRDCFGVSALVFDCPLHAGSMTNRRNERALPGRRGRPRLVSGKHSLPGSLPREDKLPRLLEPCGGRRVRKGLGARARPKSHGLDLRISVRRAVRDGVT